MVDHIYGKSNLPIAGNRPNLFIKELKMYIDYLETKIQELKGTDDKKQISYYNTFQKNLQEGILYYKHLFENYEGKLQQMKKNVFAELESFNKKLESLKI